MFCYYGLMDDTVRIPLSDYDLSLQLHLISEYRGDNLACALEIGD